MRASPYACANAILASLTMASEMLGAPVDSCTSLTTLSIDARISLDISPTPGTEGADGADGAGGDTAAARDGSDEATATTARANTKKWIGMRRGIARMPL